MKPHGKTICASEGCSWTFARHGANGECPFVAGSTFTSKPAQPHRTGASFNDDEIDLLAALLEHVQRGERPREHLIRHPAFVPVARKILAMAAAQRERATAC